MFPPHAQTHPGPTVDRAATRSIRSRRRPIRMSWAMPMLAAGLALVCMTSVAHGQSLADLLEPKAKPGATAGQDTRLAVPPDSALATAEKTLQEVFDKEISSAKSQEEKAKLADFLLSNVISDQDEAATVFVVLRKAAVLASEAGDGPLALKASRELSDRFQLPVAHAAATLIETLKNCRTNEARKATIQIAIDLARETADSGDPKAADDLARACLAAAGRLRDEKALVDSVRAVRAELTERVKLQQSAETAKAKLETSPDDAEAHELLGIYLCFVESDWNAGLAHLTKAKSEKLAEAAKTELSAAKAETPGEVYAAAADQWIAAADGLGSSWKGLAQAHAAELYRLALPTAVGLQKVRIERAIAQLAAAEKEAATRTSKSKAAKSGKPGPRGPGPGLVGRMQLDGQDVGVIVFYVPGKMLTGKDVKAWLTQAGVTPQSIRMELMGGIRLTKDAVIIVRHKGGSAAGGVLELFVDGKFHNVIGDDHYKDRTDEIPLAAGVHSFVWKLRGGELGDCLLTFTDKATGKEAVVEFDRNILGAARSAPATKEVEFGPLDE